MKFERGMLFQFISLMASEPIGQPEGPSEAEKILADWVIAKAVMQTGATDVAEAGRQRCWSLVIAYLKDRTNLPALREAIKNTFGPCRACTLLKKVVEMKPGPVGFVDTRKRTWSGRRERRLWSETEDLRLLAAMYRFGPGNWPQISKFVGNGRTRSDCHNRWNRSFNPKVSKEGWSKEEVKKLLELTASGGRLSWGDIARKIGTRCDLQCRFKYNLLMRVKSVETTAVEPPEEKSADSSSDRPKLCMPRFIVPTSQSELEDMSSDDMLTTWDDVSSDPLGTTDMFLYD